MGKGTKRGVNAMGVNTKPNGNHQSLITEGVVLSRRASVAKLRARGLSLRAISAELAKLDPKDINPDTKEPWSIVTIKEDVDLLKDEWRATALLDIGDHIARQYAEIQEAKRACWNDGDLTNLVRVIALEMRLLGTEAPAKIDDWTNKDWQEYARANGLNAEDVLAEAEAILTGATGGMASPPTGG